MFFYQKRTLTLLLLLMVVSGCTVFTDPSVHAKSDNAKIPLDPLIGNTGQPLSEVARRADVKAYAIDLEIFPASQSIAGNGAATFLILEATQQLELKLDSRFNVFRVEVDSEAASYTRKGGVITIDLSTQAAVGELVNAKIMYEGQPHVALRAPWDGGFVWDKTPSGKIGLRPRCKAKAATCFGLVKTILLTKRIAHPLN